MCVEHIPSAKAGAEKKVQHTYTGPQQGSELSVAMHNCDQKVYLMNMLMIDS